jgi:hypothetical protein
MRLLCRLGFHDWWDLPLGIPSPGRQHRLTVICHRCGTKRYLRQEGGKDVWVPWEGSGTYSEDIAGGGYDNAVPPGSATSSKP